MARPTLDGFTSALREAAGDNLVALFLFGSAARGDYDGKRSDLNTVVILTSASPDALRPLAAPVTRWVRGGQPAPLIFSEPGWRSSTDVFPIELEDMRDAHRMLAGRDPFDGLETTPADLRRELEREARGKLIQLRAAFVAAEADGKELGRLLETSAKTFFVLFRAAVRLKEGSPPAAHPTLVERMAEVAGIDAGAFDWVVGRLAGEKRPNLGDYDPLGERYVAALEHFVHWVDEQTE
jgi:hypothetical protein